METAGEGGPWGMAILAAYMLYKDQGESLESYLTERVFATAQTTVAQPDPKGVEGFRAYMARYKAALPAQKAASAME